MLEKAFLLTTHFAQAACSGLLTGMALLLLYQGDYRHGMWTLLLTAVPNAGWYLTWKQIVALHEKEKSHEEV